MERFLGRLLKIIFGKILKSAITVDLIYLGVSPYITAVEMDFLRKTLYYHDCTSIFFRGAISARIPYDRLLRKFENSSEFARKEIVPFLIMTPPFPEISAGLRKRSSHFSVISG
jgi:hypothetical protein